MYNTPDMVRDVDAGERQRERLGGQEKEWLGERVGVRNYDLSEVSSANWGAGARFHKITGLIPLLMVLLLMAGLLAMNRLTLCCWVTLGGVAVGLGAVMKWAMAGRYQCSRVNSLLDQAWRTGTAHAGASRSSQ